MKYFEKFKALLNSSTFIKGSIIYILGSVFLKGVSFILIPLYTEVFTPEDYGVMELINTVMSLLMIFITFGFSQLIYLEYTHFEEHNKLKYISKINYSFSLLALPILVVVGIILYIYRVDIFSIDTSYVIIIMLIIVYLSFFQNNIYAVLQLDQKPKLVTFNKALTGITLLVCNLIFIKYLRTGIIGVYIANVISIFVALVLLKLNLGSEKNYLQHKRVNKTEVLSLVKDGFPFIVSSLAYFGVNGIDRFIIKSLLGEQQLGLYSLGFKFGAMLEPLLIAPVLAAYNPHIFKKFSLGDFNQGIIKKTLLILLGFSIIALLLPFFASFIVNEKFKVSLTLIPIFVMGFAFLFLAQMVAAPLLYHKKKKVLVVNVIIASVINIFFNFLFIRFFKLEGSAIAFLITNICWFILTVIQSQKYSRNNDSKS